MSLIAASVGAVVWKRELIVKKVKDFLKKKGLTMPEKTLNDAITKGKTATDPNKSQKEQKRAFNEGAKKLNVEVKQQVKTAKQRVDNKAKQEKKAVENKAKQEKKAVENKAKQEKKAVENKATQEKKAIENKAK